MFLLVFSRSLMINEKSENSGSQRQLSRIDIARTKMGIKVAPPRLLNIYSKPRFK